MAFQINKVDVWAGEIEDRRGALAARFEAMMRAGANLDFIIARPLHEKPGTGLVYMAPIAGPEQERAAQIEGLRKSHIHVLRVEGPDRPGLGAGITRTLADAGLNIAGLSAAAVGDRAILYLRFNSEADVDRAMQVLRPKLGMSDAPVHD